VIAAKVAVTMLLGALFGLTAAAVSAAVASGALLERGVTLLVTNGDYIQLLAGSAAGAMFWSGIGVGVGAVVRNQVPVLVGLTAWLLFLEGLLLGDLDLIGNYGRLLPGALVAAAAGLGSEQKAPLAPGPALALLALYAAAVAVCGWVVTNRRDVA
jgi:hypothetical protein